MKAERSVTDEADAAVEALKASVVQEQANRVEDPLAVAADRARELDERLEL